MLSTRRLIDKVLSNKRSTQIISKALAEKQSSIDEYKYISIVSNYCKTNRVDLFLWDFDDTIEVQVNPFSRNQMFEVLLGAIKMTENAMTEKEKLSTVLAICLAMQYRTQVRPVEHKKTQRVIKEIQEKDIPALIVTARGPEHIEVTEKQLKELNTDFCKGWPEGTIKLDVGNKEKNVVYKDGVIYCDGVDKDICLKAFADYIGYSFEDKVIVGIDDGKNNLEKERKMVVENGGIFRGIHYLHREKKVKKFKDSFNLEKVMPQLAHHVNELTLTQEEIAIRAQQAIDKFSVSVLKQQSIFSRTGDKVSCNTSINSMHMVMQKKMRQLP